MWFSIGSSNLFPPPSKDWLQNALSDPEGLGWGGEGQGAAGKVLKMCPAEEEDKEEECALLSLLDRGKLEETLGPDLEAGVSAHVPQEDGRELEDIRTKLQKIEAAHERQELKGMEETEQQQPHDEKEAATEASSPSPSPAPCDNEATCLLTPGNGIPFHGTPIEKVRADHRSVYVGNVDYSSTAEELESLFNCCGEINRVTILCDKYSGHPKGYAYIEFAYEDSVKTAMDLDETTFRGRIIRVLPKRTNLPGISTTDRGGLRARHSGRGGPLQRYGLYIGERSRPRWRSHRGRSVHVIMEACGLPDGQCS